MGQNPSHDTQSIQTSMGKCKTDEAVFNELTQSERGMEFITILATSPGTTAIATRSGSFFTDSFIEAVKQTPGMELNNLKNEITKHITGRKRAGQKHNLQLPQYGFSSLVTMTSWKLNISEMKPEEKESQKETPTEPISKPALATSNESTNTPTPQKTPIVSENNAECEDT